MEAVDWKKKHLDSLREMAEEERRWRAVDGALRRLATRLCAAAMGADPRLDEQLRKLSAAVKSAADEAELLALSDSLADTVRALEKAVPTPPAAAAAPMGSEPPGGSSHPPRAAAPHRPDADAALPSAFTATQSLRARTPDRPAPASRWDATCAAVDALLGRLVASDPGAADADTLRAAVVSASTDTELADVLARIATLVTARSDALARERAAAATLLAQVTERLEDMAAYLASADAERRASHDDAETLNTRVMAQVHGLADAVDATEDLGVLRALVAERLEEVATQVRDFHAREGERLASATARSERMQARIVELERETRTLHRSLEQERRRARIDPLTRVANRAAFDERFAEEIARWRRFRAPVAVLVADVDRFKQLNDTFGHRVGDAALREIAACLETRRRETDVLARYGGEEFVMLLVGTPLDAGLAVAEDLRSRIAALRFHHRGTAVEITVSFGVTELREGDDAHTVFERADRALYRAKGEGRNRCVAG